MWSLILLRFLLGITLAGIYPIAMKIATDYYKKDLGKSLGFIVGALALGTSFPHLIKSFTDGLPWKLVLLSTSAIAITGGLLMVLLVPKGPFYSVPGKKVNQTSFVTVFNNKSFRSAAFGYFGHMWELYAFWAFVPIMLSTYNTIHEDVEINVALYSFIIIAFGWIGCVISGYGSMIVGAKKTASFILVLSIIMCLLSPLVFYITSPILFISVLVFWGMVVLADSPMFSTMVSNNVKPEAKGTALTIVTCIGFSITILSIQLLTYLNTIMDTKYLFLFLVIGPLIGLIFLKKS